MKVIIDYKNRSSEDLLQAIDTLGSSLKGGANSEILALINRNTEVLEEIILKGDFTAAKKVISLLALSVEKYQNKLAFEVLVKLALQLRSMRSKDSEENEKIDIVIGYLDIAVVKNFDSI